MQFHLYCDESVKKGTFYGNFYGGALVRSSKALVEVEAFLQQRKIELNFYGEVKWTKVTENFIGKYISLIDAFFDCLDRGQMKVRIMFTQQFRKPVGLTAVHKRDAYFILYYQFILHAFGFAQLPEKFKGRTIRLYLDQMPGDPATKIKFKRFLARLTDSPEFQRSQLSIPNQHIGEVTSHDHIVLQCLDIVLGAMSFRLNDLHREIPAGQKRRGRRTKAKEKLYVHILKRIRKLIPGFNPGVSTSSEPVSRRWSDQYRHWSFASPGYERDFTKSKSELKKIKKPRSR